MCDLIRPGVQSRNLVAKDAPEGIALGMGYVLRFLFAVLLGCVLLALPSRAPAQHAGGHRSHEAPTTPRERRPEPSGPRLLAPGTPRSIEVLVLRDRFSPARIEVEDGEEVVLLVRRSADGYCDLGLEIAALATQVKLPVAETVPISIQPLGREESVPLRCLPDGPTATIVRSGASSKLP